MSYQPGRHQPDDDPPPEVLEPEPIPPMPHARERWGLPAPDDLRGRRRLAWIVAVGADALQWALLPLMVEGALSPVNDAIDLVVGAIMVWLLGWHLAFLPSFAMKLVPFVDLVPTWTAAVWIATRKRLPAEPAGVGTGAPTGAGAQPRSPRG